MRMDDFIGKPITRKVTPENEVIVKRRDIFKKLPVDEPIYAVCKDLKTFEVERINGGGINSDGAVMYLINGGTLDVDYIKVLVSLSGRALWKNDNDVVAGNYVEVYTN